MDFHPELILAKSNDYHLPSHPSIGSLLRFWEHDTDSNSNLQFWKGGNRKEGQELLWKLLQRTGGNMAQKLIPDSEGNSFCGACHETKPSECGDAINCRRSFLNDHCLHSNLAAKNPFLEIMLYLLHTGGVVAEKDFISISAFLRILGQRKQEADRFAMVIPNPVNTGSDFIREFYTKIFGGEEGVPLSLEEFLQYEDTREGGTEHMKRIQRVFAEKAGRCIQGTTARIKKGLNEKISFPYHAPTARLIEKMQRAIHELGKIFWQTPAPVLEI